MTVRELLEKFNDRCVMVSMNKRGIDNMFVSVGTCLKDDSASQASLLSKFGDMSVLEYATNQQYLLIYLDD